jgi:diaminopimelate decarboxylase
MEFFKYQNENLYCEGISLGVLTKRFKTPFYVTSSQAIIKQAANFEYNFSKLKHLTCYAVKANDNLSILKLLAAAGLGADVGSCGELYRAKLSGFPANKIIMSGVGKTSDDIVAALQAKILMLKVESLKELEQISKLSKQLKLVAGISLRINPQVLAETHHAHTATGGLEHKFGIDQKDLSPALKIIKKSSNLRLIGLNLHIGSQIFKVEPYLLAISKMLKIKKRLTAQGIFVKYLDIGGGFPITYDPDKPVRDLEYFAKDIIKVLENESAKIIFEPGRYLVANASALISQIVYIKKNSQGKKFIVMDAGMSELMRPILYDAYHQIIPIKKAKSTKLIADIVGPLCESGDVLAKAREISKVREHDFLAIMSVGAYGTVMSNNYNGRLRPPELLISNRQVKIIRKGETLKQAIQNEIAI